MPYKKRYGSRNHLVWFLNDDEIEFLRANNHLENRVLFAQFNENFNCQMTYSRMRHFQAQYHLQKQERGPAYTHFEKAFVKAHYETMSVLHIGWYLGRTKGSIQKLVAVLKLKRSSKAVQVLRLYRSQNGAKSLHAKIKRGEQEHPATHLHNSYVAGQIKRVTGFKEVPGELIEVKRVQLQLNRSIKYSKK
jgi:hypothetical protein